MGEFVTVSSDEHGVGTLRLDRPKVNALNPQLWDELGEAAVALTEDDDVGAVVFWGGPKVFAAGADIKALGEMRLTDFLAHGGRLQEAFKALARIPKVTIAAINGYALGAGCELALTADFRYAAEDARLGQPEILLGIIPGAGGTQRLTRLVGIQKAKEMVFGGRFYSARECLDTGLVDGVFPADRVYEEALAAARRYAAGPYALRMAKQAIDEGIEMDLDSALRLETTLFSACLATEDSRIGLESFVEHGPGKAEFVGR
ncbi:MAG TPA: enoyl-CoA hydratase/isomerase family protein [Egibacteraceae bacterium]|nr:enoyl-CoA hydratase/isomerase family protein [Egibacteraceae bacterium]